MSRLPRRSTAALVAALFLLTACSGGSSPEEAADESGGDGGGGGGAVAAENAAGGLTDRQREHLVEDGEQTWDVEYAEGTQVVSGDGLDALVSQDDGGAYVFDADAASAAGLDLAEGRVLLVAGQAVRRITGVEEGGDRVTVTTEQASLADAIESGTVAWDVPIGFDFGQFVTAAEGQAAAPSGGDGDVRAATAGDVRLAAISMRTPDGRVVPVQSGREIGEAILDSVEVDAEAGSVAWTYEAQGNKYQFRLTSQGDAVDILIVVSRPAGDDPRMAFRAEGSIGTMRSTASNQFADGELAGSDVQLQELTSDLDLSLSVAGAGTSPVNFEVPVPMLTYTWLVGPVPVTLDLTAEIIGTVDAQANAAAQAEASFSYRGSTGFAFEGADVSTSGNTDIAEMDPEPADSSSSMGINVDAQFGVGFPHVSLSILGQGLVPHLRTGAVIGSSLEWGGPAAGFPASSLCKEAYVRIEASGGYDFEILGRSLASDKFVLYEDENRTQGESCPEEE